MREFMMCSVVCFAMGGLYGGQAHAQKKFVKKVARWPVDVVTAPVSEMLGDFQAGTTQPALEQFGGLIRLLGKTSNDWRGVAHKGLRDMNALPGTVRKELEALSKTVIHTAGQEFRCDTKFLIDQTKAVVALMGMQFAEQSVPGWAKFFLRQTPTKQAAWKAAKLKLEREAAKPFICGIAPNVIDLTDAGRDKIVDIYGYGLRKNRLFAHLVGSNGQQLDVSGHLDFPSEFHATLNVSNGVPFSKVEGSNRVNFVGMLSGFWVSTQSLAVRPPSQRICHATPARDGNFRNFVPQTDPDSHCRKSCGVKVPAHHCTAADLNAIDQDEPSALSRWTVPGDDGKRRGFWVTDPDKRTEFMCQVGNNPWSWGHGSHRGLTKQGFVFYPGDSATSERSCGADNVFACCRD